MALALWLLTLLLSRVEPFGQAELLPSCRVEQEMVDCSHLKLRTLPVQLPPTNHTLDLSNNLLQNLTHQELPAFSTLQTLNLHSNRISFIQPGLFTTTTSLKLLDLSRNSLELYAALKTSLGPLPSVQRLDLSGNGLFTDMSDYFLSDAPALTSLSLNGNSITKISRKTFNNTRALRTIDLHNNVIIEIEEGAFESLSDLSDLDLSINSISCIMDFNLDRLKMLNLSKNSISNFQTIASDLHFELLYLDLRENKILYFPVLPQRNKLLYLDLSRNHLRSVNCSGPLEELENLKESGHLLTDSSRHFSHCKSHQHLPRMLYLDMSYNHLKAVPPSFFSSMVALETLNISNNCLDSFSVETERPLNSLKNLDISFNNIQGLFFEKDTLASLEVLHLQGNSLARLDSGIFWKFRSIRSIHLQQNQLSICSPQQSPPSGCVHLSSIPTLRYLYLSENSISTVPEKAFSGSPLLVLDLSRNPGIEVTALSLSGLEMSLAHLSLSGNQLQDLAVDFSFFPNLKSLDVSANRLVRLSLWSGDSSVECLNLQNNSVVMLEARTVSALQENLRTLLVGWNPLSCCRNQQLFSLLQQEQMLVSDVDAVTCQFFADSETVEINLSELRTEHCRFSDKSVLWISVTVVLVLGLVLLLIVSLKMCHSKRHRFKRGIKA